MSDQESLQPTDALKKIYEHARRSQGVSDPWFLLSAMMQVELICGQSLKLSGEVEWLRDCISRIPVQRP